MSEKAIIESKKTRYAKKITFNLSILLLIIFLVFRTKGSIEKSYVALYLLFIVWGVNKIICYFTGGEIRVAYALKIPSEANKLIRILALIFSAFISFFGMERLIKYYLIG